MQTINLNLYKKTIIPVLYAKQGEVGRKFQVVFADGIPDGVAFSVWYSGASGEGNYTHIGDVSAFTIDGSTVTVELITQMLTNAGAGLLCLVMSGADGSQIGTWNIPYMVEPVPGMGSAAAEQYFTAFSEAIQNLPYPDVSLTAAGKAADAAAVGTALAGKAPAGYGLGGSASKIITSVAGLDDAVEIGWYRFNCPGATIGNVAISYATVHSYNRSVSDAVWQELYPTNSTAMLKRFRSSAGEWSEWEWDNPIMSLDTEYRTTERSEGKPVYTKLLYCGMMPSNTRSGTAHGAENVENVIRVSGYMSSGESLPARWSGTLATVYATRMMIYIETDGTAFDGLSARVQIWYTKS